MTGPDADGSRSTAIRDSLAPTVQLCRLWGVSFTELHSLAPALKSGRKRTAPDFRSGLAHLAWVQGRAVGELQPHVAASIGRCRSCSAWALEGL